MGEIYQFKVGAFECMAICDGIHTYAPPTFPPPATFLFVNAPGNHLEQTLREHNIQPEYWTEWISPYICLPAGKHGEASRTGGYRRKWPWSKYRKTYSEPAGRGYSTRGY